MFSRRSGDKSLTVKRNKFLVLEIKHVSIVLRCTNIKTFSYSDSSKYQKIKTTGIDFDIKNLFPLQKCDNDISVVLKWSIYE